MTVENDNNEFFAINKEGVFFILSSLLSVGINLSEIVKNGFSEENVLESQELIQNIVSAFKQILNDKEVEQEFILYAYSKFNIIIHESKDEDPIFVQETDVVQ